MTPTLLLDLDDTLLTNDTNLSTPAYFKSLSSFMKDYAEPPAFIDALVAGMEQMISNLDPSRSLEEAFGEIFYKQLALDPETAKTTIEKFYADIYPTLKSTTEYRPEAVAFVRDAQAMGYTVAIATNPLYPMAAIKHRLNWAGLGADAFVFAEVTSIESYHFTKPHPAYYAELLARMGWPEGPIVMVGNDLKMDIAGARNLGLATFWITDDPKSLPAGKGALPSSAGWLEDILPWIASHSDSQLAPRFDSRESILATLQSTIASLDTRLRIESLDFDWRERPKEDEWSLSEILCHLRDVTRDINLPRIKSILENTKEVFIEGVDSDQWAIDREYRKQDGHQALQEFVAAQKELLRLLGTLDDEAWAETATHSIFGPTSLQELMIFSNRHERLHVRQIQKTLSQLH